MSSAIKLKAARLKSCSVKVDELRLDSISVNLGCRHDPGEGGAGEGIGANATRGVDGRGTSALIMKHVLKMLFEEITLGPSQLHKGVVSKIDEKCAAQTRN